MKRKILIFLSIIITSVLILSSVKTLSKKRITVVFRYDDLSEISDTSLEKKIISLFHENDISFTAAVIPFVFNGYQGDPSVDQVGVENIPLGEEKFELLNTAVKDGVLDVSMHGFSHQTISSEGGNREFKGLDYTSQYKKISQGIEYLNSRLEKPVDTFVPPWNRYDKETLRILDQTGFKAISANQYGEFSRSSPLFFLPSTCELNELQKAIDEARKSLDTHPVIVVLFHQFDILGNELNIPLMDFGEFTSLVEWLKIQEDVEILSLEQTITQYPGLNANRYRYNYAILDSKMIPPMLTGLINSLVYQSPYPPLAIFSLYYLAILIISGLVVFLMGRSIFTLSNELIWFGRICMTLAMIFIVMYAFRGTKVGFRGATGSAIFIGATIGTWWSSFLISKNKKIQIKG